MRRNDMHRRQYDAMCPLSIQLLLLFLFRHTSFSPQNIYHSSGPSKPSCYFFFYSFDPSASYSLFFRSLLSLQKSITSLVIQSFLVGLFLPKYLIGVSFRHCCLTCDITSFSTVFQSYWEDKMVKMKALCNGTPFTVGKNSASSGSRTGDR